MNKRVDHNQQLIVDACAWVMCHPIIAGNHYLERFSQGVTLAQARHIPLILVTQCRLQQERGGKLTLCDYGLDALGESLAGPDVWHISMREVFAATDIASLFANFSGHLHAGGHQMLAHIIFAKIEEERSCLGLGAAGMAAAPAPAPAGKPAPAVPEHH